MSNFEAERLRQMLVTHPRAPEHRLYGAVFDHNYVLENTGHVWPDDRVYETLQVLLENNYAGRLDVNKPNADGYTLLHYVSRPNKPHVVDLLVKHGANVEIIFSDAMTMNLSPINFAISGASPTTIRRLLYYNVRINDLDYHSPLWQIWRFAKSFDADELMHLCALLINLGADTDGVRGCFDRTPIDEMLEYRGIANGDVAIQERAFARLQLLRAGGIGITMQIPPPRWDNELSLFVLDDENEQAKYRRMIRRAGFELICERATEICIALQSFRLPAAITVEIIDAAIPVAYRIAHWFKWQIATKVKHFIPVKN